MSLSSRHRAASTQIQDCSQHREQPRFSFGRSPARRSSQLTTTAAGLAPGASWMRKCSEHAAALAPQSRPAPVSTPVRIHRELQDASAIWRSALGIHQSYDQERPLACLSAPGIRFLCGQTHQSSLSRRPRLAFKNVPVGGRCGDAKTGPLARDKQLSRHVGLVFGLLLAVLTAPGQPPARALAALGVHRPLEVADVGADGDA